jgi:peptide/nickel transport system substrate-binding protein
VLLHVVEGLTALKEDGSVGPLLADHWMVSPDGRTYTFILRKGVRFHNGAPLTAADVVWSLDRYLDPKTRWRCLSELKGGVAVVTGVRARDASTVEVTLDRPAPLFLMTLARPDCGEAGILQKASVDAQGRWVAPIGTGPFRLGAWNRNQFVELERFPGYVSRGGPPDGNTGGKAALVDKVRYLIIPDASAARAALLRGDIDVLDGLSPTELPALRGKPGIRIEVSPTDDLYAILLQTRDPLLKDARLRRAIALSIDAAKLTKAVTWGTGDATNGPIPRASAYSGPAEAALAKANLEEARALVRQSGYKGQPIRLGTNMRYTQAFDAAVLVQAMAAQAGIHLEIETLDWATELAKYASGDYQALSFPYSARMDPSLIFGSLIGDKSRDPRKVWDTPRARSLLQQSMTEADRTRRQAVFDEMTRAFEADAPSIPLFSSGRIVGLRANVVGYRNWATAQQRLWNVSVR